MPCRVLPHAICILIFSLLGACDSPSREDISKRFRNSHNNFEALVEMIQEDSRGGRLVVGWDNIGRGRDASFWYHGGEWNKSNNYGVKMGLHMVLDQVGLSQSRYDEYMRLLKAAAAERVTYRPASGEDDARVYFLVYRQGLAVSGCMRQFVYSKSPTLPEVKHQEVYPLDKDWYVHSDCGE